MGPVNRPGKPGGGYPSRPIPILMPNDPGAAPGERVEFWYYDESPTPDPTSNQWEKYGEGTISADGKQAVPDPGVGQPKFCCGASYVQRIIEAALAFFQALFGADPVMLQTGMFALEQTDLVLPGRLPIRIARSYNPFEAFGGVSGLTLSFGNNWVLSYDVTLFQIGNAFRLVLPANKRIDFTLQPDGTYQNKLYASMQGAVFSILPNGDYQIRFKDGTNWKFGSVFTFADGTQLRFLTSQTDRNGNTVTINRSGATITSIVDASGRTLVVTTTNGRITQIHDPIGRTVTYAYNSSGRLEIVTDSEGGSTRYTYDSAGRLLTITDPCGIQYIQNFYGTSGRLLRQVLADGAEWRFRYHMQGATVTGPNCPSLSCPMEDSWENLQAGYSFQGGTVSETTVIDPRGNQTIHRFNSAGFDSEGIDALGQKSTYVRNAVSRPPVR